MKTDFKPQSQSSEAKFTFHFPAIKIGVAEYDEGPTGCTIFVFPERVMATVDVRGGDPGVTEHHYSNYDAICFAGGSLRGLEVVSGVRSALIEQYGPDRDLVSGAIVNDGRNRANNIYPDMQLGRAAYQAAVANRFPLGPHGAGRNVWVGGGRNRGVGQPEQAGQGAAFAQIGQVKIAVFTVVNAFGAVNNRQGEIVRGNVAPDTGERLSYAAGLDHMLAANETPPVSEGNTTLTLVATNQSLSPWALRQVARQVHSSMARAIQPFHTIYDGDVLYMITTGQVDESRIDPASLGIAAADVAWDAILASFE